MYLCEWLVDIHMHAHYMARSLVGIMEGANYPVSIIYVHTNA